MKCKEPHTVYWNTLWNKTSFKTVKKTHKYNNWVFFISLELKVGQEKIGIYQYLPYSFVLVILKPTHVMHKILFWHFLYFCGIKHKDYMNIHI